MGGMDQYGVNTGKASLKNMEKKYLFQTPEQQPGEPST